jgi:hypothetical protein
LAESYVHPVGRAREPRPDWIAVWRFRVAAVVVLALLTVAVIWAYNRYVTGATRQDPSFNAAPAAVAARVHAAG